MYIPKHFDEPRIDVMQELMRHYPLATLVTHSQAGINANHIPLHLSELPLPFGVLRGHVARSNPIWLDLTANVEVLVIFQGPNAYISPSWYATKQETQKVVPTWNYAVAHAYGSLRMIDDAIWVRKHLEDLTNQREAAFQEPWAVSDAPDEFIEKLIEKIVGIEIVITRLSGKWKVSQNQSAENQIGVVNGLNASEQGDALAMAALVKSKIV